MKPANHTPTEIEKVTKWIDRKRDANRKLLRGNWNWINNHYRYNPDKETVSTLMRNSNLIAMAEKLLCEQRVQQLHSA